MVLGAEIDSTKQGHKVMNYSERINRADKMIENVAREIRAMIKEATPERIELLAHLTDARMHLSIAQSRLNQSESIPKYSSVAKAKFPQGENPSSARNW
jgi:hypothetical protein